jgi:hypothetical protein
MFLISTCLRFVHLSFLVDLKLKLKRYRIFEDGAPKEVHEEYWQLLWKQLQGYCGSN